MSHLYKTWQNPDSGQKKFISSTLMYQLSKKIRKDQLEVVNESYIDVTDINSEQPDLVVYEKLNKYHPALIVECVSDKDEADAIRTIEILCRVYHIKEGYVYNFEKEQWNRIGHNPAMSASSAYSEFLNLNLASTLSEALLKYD